ncbi:MAG: hypothetical protein LBI10_07180 [Deltaproteobacteria bacterium]|nr:hypothetical protein [Deltaproteobacteria bacterium]
MANHNSLGLGFSTIAIKSKRFWPKTAGYGSRSVPPKLSKKTPAAEVSPEPGRESDQG